MSDTPELLTVPDVTAWRLWLDTYESTSDGVWLILAKKGVTEPTSLSYKQALLEALCSGWIDGQAKSIDEVVYKQRFTPRRARSLWSHRNVGYIADLEAQGRMRDRGRREVELAQADGRWERAYPGPANATVPHDLAAALAGRAGGAATFASLSRQEQFAAIVQVLTASTQEVRERRIARIVERLEVPER